MPNEFGIGSLKSSVLNLQEICLAIFDLDSFTWTELPFPTLRFYNVYSFNIWLSLYKHSSVKDSYSTPV